jgi:hypothetical protein
MFGLKVGLKTVPNTGLHLHGCTRAAGKMPIRDRQPQSVNTQGLFCRL